MTTDGKTLVAVEALVRWSHPVHGLLGPQHFVERAEQAGLIGALGEWVLRRGCRDALRWPGLGVSINVSPLQFLQSDFVDRVEALAREIGAPFAQIELEIVETAFFANPELAEVALTKLRALGFRIALDDFGTGYSSLAYLLRLPFDKVKIDKCFIDNVHGMRGAAIVHAIVALARALGMKVTAEGVENAEQQALLRAAGCHYLQGYLFSRPVPPEAIDALWARQLARAVEGPNLAVTGARGIL
jgi:EAL domain-containing protein (putative c-di-GMP-specific phosphodiesterase class I)